VVRPRHGCPAVSGRAPASTTGTSRASPKWPDVDRACRATGHLRGLSAHRRADAVRAAAHRVQVPALAGVVEADHHLGTVVGGASANHQRAARAGDRVRAIASRRDLPPLTRVRFPRRHLDHAARLQRVAVVGGADPVPACGDRSWPRIPGGQVQHAPCGSGLAQDRRTVRSRLHPLDPGRPGVVAGAGRRALRMRQGVVGHPRLRAIGRGEEAVVDSSVVATATAPDSLRAALMRTPRGRSSDELLHDAEREHTPPARAVSAFPCPLSNSSGWFPVPARTVKAGGSGGRRERADHAAQSDRVRLGERHGVVDAVQSEIRNVHAFHRCDVTDRGSTPVRSCAMKTGRCERGGINLEVRRNSPAAHHFTPPWKSACPAVAERYRGRWRGRLARGCPGRDRGFG
jgi:hypothetical protein